MEYRLPLDYQQTHYWATQGSHHKTLPSFFLVSSSDFSPYTPVKPRKRVSAASPRDLASSASSSSFPSSSCSSAPLRGAAKKPQKTLSSLPAKAEAGSTAGSFDTSGLSVPDERTSGEKDCDFFRSDVNSPRLAHHGRKKTPFDRATLTVGSVALEDGRGKEEGSRFLGRLSSGFVEEEEEVVESDKLSPEKDADGDGDAKRAEAPQRGPVSLSEDTAVRGKERRKIENEESSTADRCSSLLKGDSEGVPSEESRSSVASEAIAETLGGLLKRGGDCPGTPVDLQEGPRVSTSVPGDSALPTSAPSSAGPYFSSTKGEETQGRSDIAATPCFPYMSPDLSYREASETTSEVISEFMRSIHEYCDSSGTSISSRDAQSLESSLLSLLGGSEEKVVDRAGGDQKQTRIFPSDGTKERLSDPSPITTSPGSGLASIIDVVLTFLAEREEEKQGRRKSGERARGRRGVCAENDAALARDPGDDQGDASLLGILRGLQKDRRQPCKRDEEEEEELEGDQAFSSERDESGGTERLPLSEGKKNTLPEATGSVIPLVLDGISGKRTDSEEEREPAEDSVDGEEEETRFLENLAKNPNDSKELSSEDDEASEEVRKEALADDDSDDSNRFRETSQVTKTEADERQKKEEHAHCFSAEREKQGRETPSIQRQDTASRDSSAPTKTEGQGEGVAAEGERSKGGGRRRGQLGRLKSRSPSLSRSREEALVEAVGQRAKADLARKKRRAQSLSPGRFSTCSLSSPPPGEVGGSVSPPFVSASHSSPQTHKEGGAPLESAAQRSRAPQAEAQGEGTRMRRRQGGAHAGQDEGGGGGDGSDTPGRGRMEGRSYAGEVIDEVRSKQKEEGFDAEYLASDALRRQASREVSGRIIAYCRSLGESSMAYEGEEQHSSGRPSEGMATEEPREEEDKLLKERAERDASSCSSSSPSPAVSPDPSFPWERRISLLRDQEAEDSDPEESFNLSRDESSLSSAPAGCAEEAEERREEEKRPTEKEREEDAEEGEKRNGEEEGSLVVLGGGDDWSEGGHRPEEDDEMPWMRHRDWEETIKQVHLVTSLQEDLQNQMDLETRKNTERRRDVVSPEEKVHGDFPSSSSSSARDPVDYLTHSGENTRRRRRRQEEEGTVLVSRRKKEEDEDEEEERQDEDVLPPSCAEGGDRVEGSRMSGMTKHRGLLSTRQGSGNLRASSSSSSSSAHGCPASPASFYIGDETPSNQSESASVCRGGAEGGEKQSDGRLESLGKEGSPQEEFRRSIQKDDEDWVVDDSFVLSNDGKELNGD